MVAISLAVEVLAGDRPVGSAMEVRLRPRARILAAMARPKPASPPGKVRASAKAARFSDSISAISSAACRLICVPTRTRERLCFKASTSSAVMRSFSFGSSLASSTTMAVSSLVSEAMGTTVSASRDISTLPVLSSTTTTCLALTGSRSGWAGAAADGVAAGAVAVVVAGAAAAGVSGAARLPACTTKLVAAISRAGRASFQPVAWGRGVSRRSMR
mmetsp:Transcript_4851/g.17265  ORF Transcript_4851/g.17265 Transcript_4851/m.17265 type:complete len:216 (+) Transcript_4851:1846-2493(+)